MLSWENFVLIFNLLPYIKSSWLLTLSFFVNKKKSMDQSLCVKFILSVQLHEIQNVSFITYFLHFLTDVTHEVCMIHNPRLIENRSWRSFARRMHDGIGTHEVTRFPMNRRMRPNYINKYCNIEALLVGTDHVFNKYKRYAKLTSVQNDKPIDFERIFKLLIFNFKFWLSVHLTYLKQMP